MINDNHGNKSSLNRKDLKESVRQYICGPLTGNSSTCWQRRAENSEYQLCYKCYLYEIIPEHERNVTRNLKTSAKSKFAVRGAHSSGARSPVKPHHTHPIRPLTAVTAPSFSVTFNQFLTGPILLRNIGGAATHTKAKERNDPNGPISDTCGSMPLLVSRTRADDERYPSRGVAFSNNLHRTKNRIEVEKSVEHFPHCDLQLSILPTQRIRSPPQEFHR